MRTWICASGESFDLIALKVYGSEEYAEQLLEANPDHVGTLIFSGGEVLILPEIEIPEDGEKAEESTAPWL
jgi:hypothetical protein